MHYLFYIHSSLFVWKSVYIFYNLVSSCVPCDMCACVKCESKYFKCFCILFYKHVLAYESWWPNLTNKWEVRNQFLICSWWGGHFNVLLMGLRPGLWGDVARETQWKLACRMGQESDVGQGNTTALGRWQQQWDPQAQGWVGNIPQTQVWIKTQCLPPELVFFVRFHPLTTYQCFLNISKSFAWMLYKPSGLNAQRTWEHFPSSPVVSLSSWACVDTPYPGGEHVSLDLITDGSLNTNSPWSLCYAN